jgi:EAL domain-containing protein (putative c-di-GMP-specific phosphodiesterase class I)
MSTSDGLLSSLISGPQLIQPKCSACKDGVSQPFPMTMAFQPIVDVLESRVYAYEALVRGINNEPAGVVMAQLTEENRYAFDQNCRVSAISLAARLGLQHTGAKLSINFMPGAVYSPSACIRLTLETARTFDFPLDHLIFEITEMEEVKDRGHVLKIAQEYRRHGFQLALDDFGAGYSGLNLLADLTPDIIKLDIDLTRNLHQRPSARTIIHSTVQLCKDLGVTCIAEGIETIEELRSLRSCGIRLMQGYLFARPAFESLPGFTIPDDCEAPLAQERSAIALRA